MIFLNLLTLEGDYSQDAARIKPIKYKSALSLQHLPFILVSNKPPFVLPHTSG